MSDGRRDGVREGERESEREEGEGEVGMRERETE